LRVECLDLDLGLKCLLTTLVVTSRQIHWWHVEIYCNPLCLLRSTLVYFIAFCFSCCKLFFVFCDFSLHATMLINLNLNLNPGMLSCIEISLCKQSFFVGNCRSWFFNSKSLFASTTVRCLCFSVVCECGPAPR